MVSKITLLGLAGAFLLGGCATNNDEEFYVDKRQHKLANYFDNCVENEANGEGGRTKFPTIETYLRQGGTEDGHFKKFGIRIDEAFEICNKKTAEYNQRAGMALYLDRPRNNPSRDAMYQMRQQRLNDRIMQRR